jgi:hypothetical protein
MAKKKRKKIPPCPDPETYRLVNGKEGPHWQRKRGTVKAATLNSTLALSASLTKPSNEAAKRVAVALKEFTRYMVPGRLTARVAGAFKKSYFKKEKMDFSLLEGFEFQQEYPFEKLCGGRITLKEEKGALYIHIPVGDLYVKKQSDIVNGYHLEAILLFGDPGKEGGLRIETERSPSYYFEEEGRKAETKDCFFSLILPPKRHPWMVLLYIECELERSTPPSPTNCRMKVIKVGGG